MHDSFFARLTDLFRAPSRLMERVGEAPRVLAPTLLIVFIMAGFTWLTMPIAGPEQLEMMRDSRLMRMMPEEAWQQQYDEAMNPSPLKRGLQAAGSGISTWITILVFGLVLGFFARMSGGQGTMRQAIGVTTWSALIPFGLATLVKAPLVLLTESVFSVTIGLAAFAPGDDPGSALHQILMAYGDFFTWWGLAVLVIGFSRVFKLKTGSAAAAVLLPWALMTAIPVVIGILMM